MTPVERLKGLRGVHPRPRPVEDCEAECQRLRELVDKLTAENEEKTIALQTLMR